MIFRSCFLSFFYFGVLQPDPASQAATSQPWSFMGLGSTAGGVSGLGASIFLCGVSFCFYLNITKRLLLKVIFFDFSKQSYF